MSTNLCHSWRKALTPFWMHHGYKFQSGMRCPWGCLSTPKSDLPSFISGHSQKHDCESKCFLLAPAAKAQPSRLNDTGTKDEALQSSSAASSVSCRVHSAYELTRDKDTWALPRANDACDKQSFVTGINENISVRLSVFWIRNGRQDVGELVNGWWQEMGPCLVRGFVTWTKGPPGKKRQLRF